jgi:hypothetical protein
MLNKICQVVAVVLVSGYFGLTNVYEQAVEADQARVQLCKDSPDHITCVEWRQKASEVVVIFNGIPEQPFLESDRQTMYAAAEE